jgi:hypothetical protein
MLRRQAKKPRPPSEDQARPIDLAFEGLGAGACPIPNSILFSGVLHLSLRRSSGSGFPDVEPGADQGRDVITPSDSAGVATPILDRRHGGSEASLSADSFPLLASGFLEGVGAVGLAVGGDLPEEDALASFAEKPNRG